MEIGATHTPHDVFFESNPPHENYWVYITWRFYDFRSSAPRRFVDLFRGIDAGQSHF